MEAFGVGQQDVRRMQQDYAQWLLDTQGSRFPTTDVLAAELSALGESRRDLLLRRGERGDRNVRRFDLEDIAHLRAQAWHAAERDGQDRVVTQARVARVWQTYLRFLIATARWEGPATEVRGIREALTVAPRPGLLGRGPSLGQHPSAGELPALQRSALVRHAEDVLRGRSPGDAGFARTLAELGYRSPAGRKGPTWWQWDSTRVIEAATARRRLVVVSVRDAVRADPGAGFAVAMVTSSVPTEVALGGRMLADVVASGRLPGLVSGGVLPSRAPWRIARGMQPAVHVGLTRLADDGALPWAESETLATAS